MKRGSLIVRKGDRIGVSAPGFALRASKLESGLSRLRRWGYQPVEGLSVRASAGYFAGSDDERLDDLISLSSDRQLQALWFARGGYGCARLLDGFIERIGRGALPLYLGFSDLSALFAAVLTRRQHLCIHAPLVTQLGDRSAFHMPSLRASLTGGSWRTSLPKRQVLHTGTAEGRLLGGNLSVLTSLIGTDHFPDLRGAVLFLEEVGEETYRIDRMLTQWRQAGVLKGLRGVLLGSFSTPERKQFPPDRELRDVFAETFLPLGVPVVGGLASGHVSGHRSLPLGGKAMIDGDRATLVVEAIAVRR